MFANLPLVWSQPFLYRNSGNRHFVWLQMVIDQSRKHPRSVAQFLSERCCKNHIPFYSFEHPAELLQLFFPIGYLLSRPFACTGTQLMNCWSIIRGPLSDVFIASERWFSLISYTTCYRVFKRRENGLHGSRKLFKLPCKGSHPDISDTAVQCVGCCSKSTS